MTSLYYKEKMEDYTYNFVNILEKKCLKSSSQCLRNFIGF